MLPLQVEAVSADPDMSTAFKVGATHEADCESTVRLTIPGSKGNGQTSAEPCVVRFRYCEPMHAVLAACDTHSALLDSIDSNDDGLSWPHSVYSSAQGRKLPAEGRPYKWCQHLGGLDLFLLQSTTAAGDSAVMHTFSVAMFIRRVKQLLASKFR